MEAKPSSSDRQPNDVLRDFRAASARVRCAREDATDCIAFDPQFTREHTLTVEDGRATLTSPGGIQTSLKPVKPGCL